MIKSIKINGVAEIVYNSEGKVIEEITIEPTEYLDLNKVVRDAGVEDAKSIGKVCGQYVNTVVLPDWITDIGIGAFSKTDIRRVVWPSCCDNIPWHAFWGSRIEEVQNISHVKTIGDQAFWGCKELKHFIVPDGVTEIPWYCFGRSGLETIDGLEHVEKIGMQAFAESKLKGSIRWPDKCTVVEEGVFEGCSYLQEVKNLQNVSTVKDSAFAKMGSYYGYHVNLDFSESPCHEFGKWVFDRLDPQYITLPKGISYDDIPYATHAWSC